ncbi:MAG: geranylgeranylglyceryl/heptaprenylglyceryl phosphate synthase, partial [Calditrichaeota bacterium]|nr:geranylgeranylglyceryl/heptaprenylglyceryl phosphate synthase [Calditrichota bacterium]
MKQDRGAGYFMLIDPDKWDSNEIVDLAMQANAAGADAIMVGGSLLLSSSFDELVKVIKKQIDIPLII